MVGIYKSFTESVNPPHASFFFILGFAFTWAGFWLYLFLPNTLKIVLHDDGVEVFQKHRQHKIAYKAITDVKPHISTHYSSWFGVDFYSFSFFNEKKQKQTIYFRCNGGWFLGGSKEPDLGKVLLSRARWARYGHR